MAMKTTSCCGIVVGNVPELVQGKQLQETIGNPGDIDVPSKQSIEIIEIGYFATEEHLIRWNCCCGRI
jgi:hypothetical protein